MLIPNTDWGDGLAVCARVGIAVGSTVLLKLEVSVVGNRLGCCVGEIVLSRKDGVLVATGLGTVDTFTVGDSLGERVDGIKDDVKTDGDGVGDDEEHELHILGHCS